MKESNPSKNTSFGVIFRISSEPIEQKFGGVVGWRFNPETRNYDPIERKKCLTKGTLEFVS